MVRRAVVVDAFPAASRALTVSVRAALLAWASLVRAAFDAWIFSVTAWAARALGVDAVPTVKVCPDTRATSRAVRPAASSLVTVAVKTLAFSFAALMAART